MPVVRVLRLGHGHVERARHRLQLRRRAPPAGRRVRLPVAHRAWSSSKRARGWWPTSIGIDPAEVRIGMPVEVEMVAVDDELTLPMFRPAAPCGRRERRGGLMDFTFTEEQQAVSRGRRRGVRGHGGHRRGWRRSRKAADRFDAELWSELARANLLGPGGPRGARRLGARPDRACLVLEQQGRAVAPVPLWATVVLGALPVARFGTPAQQARWLPAVVAGDVRLSAALTEVAASAAQPPDGRAPSATARGGGCTGPPSPCPRPTSPRVCSCPRPSTAIRRRHRRGARRPRRPRRHHGAGDDHRPPDPPPPPPRRVGGRSRRRAGRPRRRRRRWWRGCSTGRGRGCAPSSWA